MIEKRLQSTSEMVRQEIAQRAYAIWESEGKPLGRDFDHWLRAEAEVGASGDTPQSLRRRSARRRSRERKG